MRKSDIARKPGLPKIVPTDDKNTALFYVVNVSYVDLRA